jgi:hypothetical protein
MGKVLSKLLIAAFILFAASASVWAKAMPPLLVVGPECGAGSARANRWVMFEDRNGDGTYDFVLRGDCDGNVSGRPWEGNVQADPWMPSTEDVLIGHLPVGVTGVTHDDISMHEESSGLYSWTIVERVPTGTEVCRIQRNAAMVLSCTCPPDDGEGGLE